MGLRQSSIDIEIRSARQVPAETGIADEDPPRLSPTRLLLVRHGESTWNREHRIQGQSDPPLSDDGRRQAAHLGRRLAARRFRGFYSSDLERAFETSQVIAQATGSQPMPMQELREVFLGEWEGLNTDEIAERYPDAWARWREEPSWDLAPGGEGAAPFASRVESALDRIFKRHPDGDVLVVTHGGVIQVALHQAVGRPSHGLFPFRIQNASISVIERRDGRLIVTGVNDVAHLE
jgi:broad specificity phosphatase PhoE